MDFTLSLTTETSRLHPTPQYVHTVRTFLSYTTDLDSKTSEMAEVGQACAHAQQLTQSDSKKDTSLPLTILESNPLADMLSTSSPCTSSHARTHL